MLLRRSGLVLAVVTRDVAGRDEDMQTLDPDDVSGGVEEVMASVPDDTMVSVTTLSSLHEALRRPLQYVQVVPHAPAVGMKGSGDATLSRLWLCRHHAQQTELKRLQQRQQAATTAVSQLVQWYWRDGRSSHAYGHECNTQLESAFHKKQGRVVVHVEGGGTHTVALHKWPMQVIESGATVLRISGKTCVCWC